MNPLNSPLIKENFTTFPLGMAYVPMQVLTKVYEDPKEAYKKGTLFPELYKPFTGKRGVTK